MDTSFLATSNGADSLLAAQTQIVDSSYVWNPNFSDDPANKLVEADDFKFDRTTGNIDKIKNVTKIVSDTSDFLVLMMPNETTYHKYYDIQTYYKEICANLFLSIVNQEKGDYQTIRRVIKQQPTWHAKRIVFISTAISIILLLVLIIAVCFTSLEWYYVFIGIMPLFVTAYYAFLLMAGLTQNTGISNWDSLVTTVNSKVSGGRNKKSALDKLGELKFSESVFAAGMASGQSGQSGQSDQSGQSGQSGLSSEITRGVFGLVNDFIKSRPSK